jgi:hypothetical protein
LSGGDTAIEKNAIGLHVPIRWEKQLLIFGVTQVKGKGKTEVFFYTSKSYMKRDKIYLNDLVVSE